MTFEKKQQNFEKVSNPFKIFSPSKEDFEKLPMEKLIELWRENHKKIKKLLHDIQPPYFGLHGTSQENFQQIETTSRCSAEIATFYEKEYESE